MPQQVILYSAHTFAAWGRGMVSIKKIHFWCPTWEQNTSNSSCCQHSLGDSLYRPPPLVWLWPLTVSWISVGVCGRVSPRCRALGPTCWSQGREGTGSWPQTWHTPHSTCPSCVCSVRQWAGTLEHGTSAWRCTLCTAAESTHSCTTQSQQASEHSPENIHGYSIQLLFLYWFLKATIY